MTQAEKIEVLKAANELAGAVEAFLSSPMREFGSRIDYLESKLKKYTEVTFNIRRDPVVSSNDQQGEDLGKYETDFEGKIISVKKEDPGDRSDRMRDGRQ